MFFVVLFACQTRSKDFLGHELVAVVLAATGLFCIQRAVRRACAFAFRLRVYASYYALFRRVGSGTCGEYICAQCVVCCVVWFLGVFRALLGTFR